MIVLNPNFISFFEKELQSLSRLRIWTRCSVQYWLWYAIFHDIKMNRVFWMAHEATGNGVDTFIRRGKYPSGWLIGSTYIGQHCVILYNSLTANRCIFRQKCSESNSRSFATSKKYIKYLLGLPLYLSVCGVFYIIFDNITMLTTCYKFHNLY